MMDKTKKLKEILVDCMAGLDESLLAMDELCPFIEHLTNPSGKERVEKFNRAMADAKNIIRMMFSEIVLAESEVQIVEIAKKRRKVVTLKFKSDLNDKHV